MQNSFLPSPCWFDRGISLRANLTVVRVSFFVAACWIAMGASNAYSARGGRGKTRKIQVRAAESNRQFPGPS